MAYQTFIRAKGHRVNDSGFNPVWMPDFLFDFQKALVEWAVRKGRAAIFADCGLGKTPMQLVWAANVVHKTNKPVLIFTPLAVAPQTIREGEKFGIECRQSRDGIIKRGINVTNYQQLHKFDPSGLAGVVADECFPPDTPVEVFDIDNSLGLRYIKDIRIGDRIINANGVDSVKAIYKRPVNRAIRLGVSGRGFVTCSENHPFFTVHGWRPAKYLQCGDCLLETEAAMCLVREGVPPEVCSKQDGEVLRNILLSEMENASAGSTEEGSLARGGKEKRTEEVRMAPERNSCGYERTSQGRCLESSAESGIEKEAVIDIAENEAQTFRAWWKRDGFDRSAAEDDGCTVRELDFGLAYITGPTNTRFSVELQSRFGERQAENRNRVGRTHPPQPEGTRREERQAAGVAWVESVEVLELGHPDLDRFRDAEGKLYFYDIKAERHPSFSVKGILVHNSSILKNFDGKTRKAVAEFMSDVPYRLLCTATPAPNDFMELGTSSEALGVMTRNSMLGMFFANDGETTQQWRLKGHAKKRFWQWMASWARAIRKPSDLGFPNGGFRLPPLRLEQYQVEGGELDGFFPHIASTLGEQRKEKRRSLEARCEKVAEVLPRKRSAVVWCQLNQESEVLVGSIPDAVEVKGSDRDEEKEERLNAFSSGRIRVLITKPTIAGFGLNWQHCSNVAYFPTHSHEQFYQAVRRCWRFGQEREVVCRLVYSESEQKVLSNMLRKERQNEELFAGIIREMNDVLKVRTETNGHVPMGVPSWLSKTK